LAVQHEKTHNFQTPIDEIDAAARVLDPVIGSMVGLIRCGKVKGGRGQTAAGAAGKKSKSKKGSEGDSAGGGDGGATGDYEPPWGHFLKDFQKCEW
jgi:hypothetical protein